MNPALLNDICAGGSMWQNTKPNKAGDNFYSVLCLTGNGMEALRQLFPDGKADEMNAVLFSTSGIHGSYATIEDVEAGGEDSPEDVTFVVIQPRIVCMRYGNAQPKTTDDFAYLKGLRESSLRAMSTIGLSTPITDGCLAGNSVGSNGECVRWTNQRPTRAGLYYWQDHYLQNISLMAVRVVSVSKYANRDGFRCTTLTAVGENSFPTFDCDLGDEPLGMWAGPLPDPD